MDHCDGSLVMHSDGTPAACTEELSGRCCPGPWAEHDGGRQTCEDALGRGGCELCSFDVADDLVIRHAVRIGAMTRTHRRCRATAVGAVPAARRVRPAVASVTLPFDAVELAARH